jgi:hypothetical protein
VPKKSLNLLVGLMICVISCMSFSGCTSSKKFTPIELSRENRKAVKNISVSEEIKFAYYDMQIIPIKYTIWGCCIGPCGLYSGVMIDLCRGNRYKKKLKKVVNLEEILKYTLNKQFKSVLKEDRHFKYVEYNNKDIKPDAEFLFVIQLYGFISSEISLKALTPMISIDVYLIKNPPYKVIWNTDRKFESKDPESNPIIFYKQFNWNGSKNDPAHTMEEYLKNPTLVADAYTQACKQIAMRIMNDL